MATLLTLIETKQLTQITVPLDVREFPCRWVYVFPEMLNWINETLPNLEPGRLKASSTPQEQFDNVLYKWISGKEIRYDRMFKDLMPMADEVWELKTVDLRMFGWLCAPRKFIVVFGDYADSYKPPNIKASYEAARIRVINARNFLSLDEPKIAKGNFNALV
jgi:hypothetical protein